MWWYFGFWFSTSICLLLFTFQNPQTVAVSFCPGFIRAIHGRVWVEDVFAIFSRTGNLYFIFLILKVSSQYVSWPLSVQFSSVAQSCPTLCNPMDRSTPGLPVHHRLPEFTQTHVHRVGDAIQPSHPLSSPFPPAPNPSQHQSLFQWVNSSHQVAKVLEFQL